MMHSNNTPETTFTTRAHRRRPVPMSALLGALVLVGTMSAGCSSDSKTNAGADEPTTTTATSDNPAEETTTTLDLETQVEDAAELVDAAKGDVCGLLAANRGTAALADADDTEGVELKVRLAHQFYSELATAAEAAHPESATLIRTSADDFLARQDAAGFEPDAYADDSLGTPELQLAVSSLIASCEPKPEG